MRKTRVCSSAALTKRGATRLGQSRFHLHQLLWASIIVLAVVWTPFNTNKALLVAIHWRCCYMYPFLYFCSITAGRLKNSLHKAANKHTHREQLEQHLADEHAQKRKLGIFCNWRHTDPISNQDDAYSGSRWSTEAGRNVQKQRRQCSRRRVWSQSNRRFGFWPWLVVVILKIAMIQRFFAFITHLNCRIFRFHAAIKPAPRRCRRLAGSGSTPSAPLR